MSTYSLNKTNPKLTGNIKIVLDSEQTLWFESINSSEILARSTYKGFEMSDKFSYETNLRNYVQKFTNSNVLYDVKNEFDVNITNDLSTQYHQLYHAGCYSEESQLITENFRCFAPIWIDELTDDKPDKFVILKMSSQPVENETFSTWFDKGQVVQIYDLAELDSKIFSKIKNSYVDMSFEDVIGWSGRNIGSGLVNRAEEHVFSDLIKTETTISEFDNWITNGFQRNGLIFDNILNIEFAFTDAKVDGKFVRYSGFYVKSNQITDEIASQFADSGNLLLFNSETGVTPWTSSIVSKDYLSKEFSLTANSFGLDKQKLLDFEFVLNPMIGQKIQIKYAGKVEYELKFTSLNIKKTIEQTAQLIIDDINHNWKGQSVSITAKKVGIKGIRLRSASAKDDGDKITVSLPTHFKIKQPQWTSIGFQNQFIGSGSNTIMLNSWINPEVYPILQWLDDSGQTQSSKIVRVYNYEGDWAYELEDAIQNKIQRPGMVWLVKIKSEYPILCTILEHRELQMFNESSEYSDPLDFDTEKYKAYLLSEIDSPDFIGNVVEYYGAVTIDDITNSQLEAYKQVLVDKIGLFFNNVDLNRNYLFGDIDIANLESTTVQNEYDRLEENSNIELMKSNRLYQFINKWSRTDGVDVYNNPYRLNIALPFRYDSFAPLTIDVKRDIRYHSHSWFMLGEGQPPYYEVDEANIKKLLSYTKYPVTKEILLSEDEDAYAKMFEFSTESSRYYAWSAIEYDPLQKCCFTFFKGIKYKFESSDYDGWKFAIVLKSSILVEDDIYEMGLVKNDKFKTLTLFISFFIPDPILCHLERGTDWYFLDRSLLYFSNEIYASSPNAIDFGTDRISLNLYDDKKQKYYLDENVPVTSNWFHNIGTAANPDRIIWVGRGDKSIFSISFSDIFTIGQSLTIEFTSHDNQHIDYDNPLSVYFGMKIIFEDFVEIGIDHFWCKKIRVIWNNTLDPEGQEDNDISDNTLDQSFDYDILAMFLANPKLFYEDNAAYISKGIAAENCIYDKIVNPNANNARYKELSLANIKAYLSNNPVKINDSSTDWLSIFIQQPKEFRTLIKLKSENSSLQLLENQYTYPMLRWQGLYVPQTRSLQKFHDIEEWKQIIPANHLMTNSYRSIISKIVSSNTKLGYDTEAFDDFNAYPKKSDQYHFLKSNNPNNQVYEFLEWICYPAEHRNRISLVFNSAETIIADFAVASSIDLLDLLKDRVKKWIDFDNLFTDSVKERYAVLKYDVESSTIPNVNIENDICRDFIVNVFLKIYRISWIKKTSGQIVQFNLTNTKINVLYEQGIIDGDLIQIQFTR